VLLTYVVGELQAVRNRGAGETGHRADISSIASDRPSGAQHAAAAFVFFIELVGDTRHLSKREEAVDAIVAACDLVPRLNA